MHETSHQPKQRPAPDEHQSRFPAFDPSVLQTRQLAESPEQQALDTAVDDNIKLFCERVAKSNDLDTLAYRAGHLADGTDGKFLLQHDDYAFHVPQIRNQQSRVPVGCRNQ